MKKLILTICKICGESKTPIGMSQHILKSHNMTIVDYIIQYEYNNIHPLCQCGCGKKVTIRGYKVMDYVDGHCPLNQFKEGVNPRKNVDQWKDNLTAGVRNYNKLTKIKNPEYRKGINNNFYGKTHSQETKDKIKQKVEEQIKSKKHAFIGNANGRIGKSSLELKFENYIKSIGVDYEHNYKIGFIPEGKQSVRYKYYDFYIPIINTVVEIHGSYWHPQRTENLSTIQKNNLKNDAFKKNLSKERHYNILTIYDYELDNFISENLLTNIIKESARVSIDITMSGYITDNTIIFPKYWKKMTNQESITVDLIPIDKQHKLYVKEIDDSKVTIGTDRPHDENINCFYVVYAERIDIEKLTVEY